MNNALSDAAKRQLALKLLIAATAEEPTAGDTRERELIFAQMNPRNASELADMVAGGSADASQMGEASKQAGREVGLKGDGAPRGGPRNKMARISASASSHEEHVRQDTHYAKL